jgi:nucleoside-diphosphate-sugar epimerase
MTDVLIIGCGYLGRRAAMLWQSQGRHVAALTRSRSDELAALGIEPIVGDVLEPASLKLPAAKTLLYAVGLDRTSGRTMEEVYIQGLSNVLADISNIERIIYISSTSVYGQTDGEWVNESSATEPIEASGKVVLAAEKLLRSKRSDAVILRFAGIYGPGRLLQKNAILIGEPLGGDPEKWLNLIHVDDGAKAILLAEYASSSHSPPWLCREGLGEGHNLAHSEPSPGPSLQSQGGEENDHGDLFNVSDGSPVTRREFYSTLAKLLHALPPVFTETPSSRATHRRITNDLIKRRLGFAPAFPDCHSGLAHAVAAEAAATRGS